jgi:hypothetical protein
MNNFQEILNNRWIQMFILLLIFWFLFLREDFISVPIPTTDTCKVCKKQNFDKTIMNEKQFTEKCLKLSGVYKNNGCHNYKATIDSNYNCSCEIK